MADLMVSDANDDRPLPEIVIDELGGTMAHIDVDGGTRLYCVRDWVYWVSGSKSKRVGDKWVDLKQALIKEGHFKVTENLRTLSIDTPGGPQPTDFIDERGLYEITQRMADKSSTVRWVKKYLASCGVVLDHMRIEELESPGNRSIQDNILIGQTEAIFGRTIAEILIVVSKEYYAELLSKNFTPEEAVKAVQNAITKMAPRIANDVMVAELHRLGLTLEQARLRVQFLAPLIANYVMQPTLPAHD